MPKSRRKKNEHKDFQKVKLKVGKRLKKADNVTDASFHTKTIQVTQKIKTGSSSEPSSKRKLNVCVSITWCGKASLILVQNCRISPGVFVDKTYDQEIWCNILFQIYSKSLVGLCCDYQYIFMFSVLR